MYVSIIPAMNHSYFNFSPINLFQVPSAGASVFTKDQPVTVTVDSRFMVSSFEGTKSIVFATTSWLGGKNLFLAYVI